MKCCVIFLFLGLVAQLQASVIQTRDPNDSDADIEVSTHKRVVRNAAEEDSNNEKVGTSDGRKHLRQHDGVEEKKVLAFGLDTGAPDTKNSLVQAISDAFGGLVQSQSHHARSNNKGDKHKPLALELKSESLLRGLENFLGSPKVKKITRDLARKAAIVYRAIEKEL